MVVSYNKTEANTPDITDNRQDRNNPTPPSILIVDDDEDSRSMLRLLLGMWNYQVTEAADGIEAIDVAGQMRPDLILMDVKLPHLDGFETARQIRQSVPTDSMPIIFLSACTESIFQRQAFAAGGNEYLTKPLDFEKLERTLDKYIRR